MTDLGWKSVQAGEDNGGASDKNRRAGMEFTHVGFRKQGQEHSAA